MAPDLAFEATSPLMAVAALREHTGPVLLVAADVPGLSAAHATDALADLRDGAQLVYAPTTDGSAFLVALPSLDEELLDLLDQGFPALAGAAAARGDGIGMLGSERRLTGPADAAALAADPRAAPELLAHLREALTVRGPLR